MNDKLKELRDCIYDITQQCIYCNVKKYDNEITVNFDGSFTLTDLKLIIKKFDELGIE